MGKRTLKGAHSWGGIIWIVGGVVIKSEYEIKLSTQSIL